jgi:hypothetical protein
MAELSWKIARPLSDERLINKLAETIGATLPNDYVECVRKNNAGYPSLKSFNTQNGVEHVFNNLLTLDDQKEVNVFSTYEVVSAASGKNTLLPIAEDPFGNYICLDFSMQPARVVFWEHETKSTEDIDDDFSSLLEQLI